MTRIAAIWAGLGDDAEANDWYRDKQIPAAVKKIESTARNAERKEENVFQEVTHVEGRHMTIYDLPDGPSEEELEAQIRPALEEIPGDAQLKTRCYREYANWFGEDWRGGMSTWPRPTAHAPSRLMTLHPQIPETSRCGR